MSGGRAGDESAGEQSLDPAQLDGHTIESLSDYLDRGREPRDPAIESSPAAQHALAALVRLRIVAPKILVAEAEKRDSPSEHWIRRILDQISIQARAGRDIPIDHRPSTAALFITEGAIRALVREVGDGLEGLLVERVSLDGEFDSIPAHVVIVVDASMLEGADVAALGEEFGRRVRSTVAHHTELAVTDVVVRVRDTGLTPEDLPDEGERA